jgi:hypothetical protein
MVLTTTEHLALRLGRALKKAFDGKVRNDFLHENNWRTSGGSATESPEMRGFQEPFNVN